MILLRLGRKSNEENGYQPTEEREQIMDGSQPRDSNGKTWVKVFFQR